MMQQLAATNISARFGSIIAKKEFDPEHADDVERLVFSPQRETQIEAALSIIKQRQAILRMAQWNSRAGTGRQQQKLQVFIDNPVEELEKEIAQARTLFVTAHGNAERIVKLLDLESIHEIAESDEEAHATATAEGDGEKDGAEEKKTEEEKEKQRKLSRFWRKENEKDGLLAKAALILIESLSLVVIERIASSGVIPILWMYLSDPRVSVRKMAGKVFARVFTEHVSFMGEAGPGKILFQDAADALIYSVYQSLVDGLPHVEKGKVVKMDGKLPPQPAGEGGTIFFFTLNHQLDSLRQTVSVTHAIAALLDFSRKYWEVLIVPELVDAQIIILQVGDETVRYYGLRGLRGAGKELEAHEFMIEMGLLGYLRDQLEFPNLSHAAGAVLYEICSDPFAFDGTDEESVNIIVNGKLVPDIQKCLVENSLPLLCRICARIVRTAVGKAAVLPYLPKFLSKAKTERERKLATMLVYLTSREEGEERSLPFKTVITEMQSDSLVASPKPETREAVGTALGCTIAFSNKDDTLESLLKRLRSKDIEIKGALMHALRFASKCSAVRSIQFMKEGVIPLCLVAMREGPDRVAAAQLLSELAVHYPLHACEEILKVETGLPSTMFTLLDKNRECRLAILPLWERLAHLEQFGKAVVKAEFVDLIFARLASSNPARHEVASAMSTLTSQTHNTIRVSLVQTGFVKLLVYILQTADRPSTRLHCAHAIRHLCTTVEGTNAFAAVNGFREVAKCGVDTSNLRVSPLLRSAFVRIARVCSNFTLASGSEQSQQIGGNRSAGGVIMDYSSGLEVRKQLREKVCLSVLSCQLRSSKTDAREKRSVLRVLVAVTDGLDVQDLDVEWRGLSSVSSSGGGAVGVRRDHWGEQLISGHKHRFSSAEPSLRRNDARALTGLRVYRGKGDMVKRNRVWAARTLTKSLDKTNISSTLMTVAKSWCSRTTTTSGNGRGRTQFTDRDFADIVLLLDRIYDPEEIVECLMSVRWRLSTITDGEVSLNIGGSVGDLVCGLFLREGSCVGRKDAREWTLSHETNALLRSATLVVDISNRIHEGNGLRILLETILRLMANRQTWVSRTMAFWNCLSIPFVSFSGSRVSDLPRERELACACLGILCDDPSGYGYRLLQAYEVIPTVTLLLQDDEDNVKGWAAFAVGRVIESSRTLSGGLHREIDDDFVLAIARYIVSTFQEAKLEPGATNLPGGVETVHTNAPPPQPIKATVDAEVDREGDEEGMVGQRSLAMSEYHQTEDKLTQTSESKAVSHGRNAFMRASKEVRFGIATALIAITKFTEGALELITHVALLDVIVALQSVFGGRGEGSKKVVKVVTQMIAAANRLEWKGVESIVSFNNPGGFGDIVGSKAEEMEAMDRGRDRQIQRSSDSCIKDEDASAALQWLLVSYKVGRIDALDTMSCLAVMLADNNFVPAMKKRKIIPLMVEHLSHDDGLVVTVAAGTLASASLRGDENGAKRIELIRAQVVPQIVACLQQIPEAWKVQEVMTVDVSSRGADQSAVGGGVGVTAHHHQHTRVVSRYAADDPMWVRPTFFSEASVDERKEDEIEKDNKEDVKEKKRVRFAEEVVEIPDAQSVADEDAANQQGETEDEDQEDETTVVELEKPPTYTRENVAGRLRSIGPLLQILASLTELVPGSREIHKMIFELRSVLNNILMIDHDIVGSISEGSRFGVSFYEELRLLATQITSSQA